MTYEEFVNAIDRLGNGSSPLIDDIQDLYKKIDDGKKCYEALKRACEKLPDTDPMVRYMKEQAACGIKVGDTVRVISIPTEGVITVSGWNNKWMPGMEKWLGKTGEVIDVAGNGYGIQVDMGGKGSLYDTWCFPWFVLSVVKEERRICVGDMVKVLYKPSLEDIKISQWDNSWPDEMDKCVGKAGIVVAIGEAEGPARQYKVFFGADWGGYAFPSFVLEKVAENAGLKPGMMPRDDSAPLFSRAHPRDEERDFHLGDDVTISCSPKQSYEYSKYDGRVGVVKNSFWFSIDDGDWDETIQVEFHDGCLRDFPEAFVKKA